MSGPIRKLLGPTRARLQGYIKNARVIFMAPITDKDLEKDETAIEDLIHRMETNTALLEKCNDEWKALLKELKGDSKAVEAEEKEYLWAAEGDDGIIELLLDSKETTARLQARLNKVLRLLKEKTERRPLENLKPPDHGEQQPNPQMKLPKLNLPTFDGNLLHWQEFWDIFDCAVHQQNISNITKFSYLKNSLRGAAASAVCGISVTQDNYLMVIQLLKEKFGNKQAIVEALYSQLQYLPVAINRFTEIKYTYEAIEKILRQLESQKENIDQQRIIVQQILSKFPTDVIVKLEESKRLNEHWTVASLRESLKRYVTVYSNAYRYEVMSKPFNVRNNRTVTPYKDKQLSAEALVANSQHGSRGQYSKGEPSKPCIFCKGTHFNDNCDKYFTVNSRKSQLTNQGRCFICLKIGHLCKECPSAQRKSCYYCNRVGHHHRSICPKRFDQSSNSTGDQALVNLSSERGQSQPLVTTSETSVESASVANNVNLSHSLLACGERVLLQTAKVTVLAEDGSKISANLLLDSASQRTFMTDRLAKQLKLSSQQRESLLVSTFGGKRPQSLDTYVVKFTIATQESLPIVLHANVLPQITGPIQCGPLLEKDLEFLKIISPGKLADTIPETSKSTTETVDILVGSDYFWDMVEKERVVLPSGLFLLSSKLGYILTGKYLDPTIDRERHCNQTVSFCVTTSYPNLCDLWDLDQIGIRDSPYVRDDDKALEQFNNTIQYKEGRYHITWPWKFIEFDLPENFDVAFGRMKSLSRRIQNDQNLLKQYCEIIQLQLASGIIEEVDDNQLETENRRHYLPHHPVITPYKASTKVRIVFDASVKASKGVKSLNECLYRGPINLPDMCGILLRFRIYYIAILADIEKAFLQIGIKEQERDVTRFLWFKDPSKPQRVEGNLCIYRFCRVPFGIICSPFLLEATLRYHLNKEGSDIATMICDNIYVDNVSVGASSVQEAYKIYEQAKQILERASMNLRQWSSNCNEFLNSLPNEEKTTGLMIRVFGLTWNRLEDYLQVCGPKNAIIKRFDITKRHVISEVSQIYDPLGLVTPVVFYGKVFLQKLWTTELGWDDALPQSLCHEWEEMVQMLQQLSKLRIPRFVSRNNESVSYQILTFCDASAKSYAAAVYLRVTSEELVQVNLVFSKMRLAPCDVGKKRKTKLKQLSLPRLELLAVLIGTRVTNFVTKELKLCISKRMIFTDSQCVLYWLKSSKPLPVFVQNRVNEIRQEKHVSFGYIPSEENPADFATRGLTVSEIKESKLWWHGPNWLQYAECNWPSWNLSDISSDDLERMLSQVKCGSDMFFESVNVVQENSDQTVMSVCTIDERKYSSLRKLLRVTVFCLKFIKKRVWNRCSDELKERICNRHKILKIIDDLGDHGIYSQDIKSVRLFWVYVVQQRRFADVFCAITKKQRNGLKKQLGLIPNEFGILTCHGRFLHAEMSEDAKYPKLLPRHTHFTKLIIQEVHERLIHAGISHTLASLRQEYWVPQGRAEVRTCLSHCLTCRRHEGPAFSLPKMPPWPKQRVSESLPFQFVGLDYLGPVFVKEGPVVSKMWICLFTCLAIRAVHLEWVRSLSAEHFLLCLRRFMARRGRPELIISDNATQFKLVKTVIDEQWRQLTLDEELVSYLSNNGIKWKFTTALAPWQGGFYERLVGLVKRSLRKGIGLKRLTLDQFVVMLDEVEAVINTRPLTYVYEEFESGFSLTPAHFLNANLRCFPLLDTEVDYYPTEDSMMALLNNWKKGQKQLNMFWDMWRKEYLTSLREMSPYHKSVKGQIHHAPGLGQVVLIKDENTARGMWRLGRIEKLNKDSDGNIRTAKIYLPNGRYIQRAINQLHPLEVPDELKEVNQVSNENGGHSLQHAGHVKESEKGPTRKAAITARQRINQLLKTNALTVTF